MDILRRRLDFDENQYVVRGTQRLPLLPLPGSLQRMLSYEPRNRFLDMEEVLRRSNSCLPAARQWKNTLNASC